MTNLKDKLRSGERETNWWTYFPVLIEDNTLVGSGGYKGPPNEAGEVEIGYEIAAAYRNRGLATELAKALVNHAFGIDGVTSVLAHTLGEVNASTKVLSTCGFQKTGELDDEENGTLWKWEIKRDAVFRRD